MKCHQLYILCIILLLFNFINTKSIKLSNDDKEVNNIEDKYYLIYVNNKYGEYKVFSNGQRNQKREESQIFVESLVDEINNLINDNKETYLNPEKLSEMKVTSHKLKKRSQTVYSYDELNLVYPISSVNDKVVLYGYLSETIAKILPSKFENIIECVPDKYSSKIQHQNYDVEEILAATHWKSLSVRENAELHLSLLSQGKYTNLVNKYDSNYYYPSSAGKDIDIVLLDTSFNFDYSEFSNTERIARCAGIVDHGIVSVDVSQGCNISQHFHGEHTSVSAAGLTHGVASRANVYGIAIATNEKGEITNSNMISGIQYIYENMIRPHKTVINFSLGSKEEANSNHYILLKELIDNINKKGGIVVSSAGNEGKNLDTLKQYYVPCEFDNVICVGGIDNGKRRSRNMYSLAYFSNYGKNVNVYAPSTINVDIIKNSKVVHDETYGTSFSTPIVTGIIATIMGENTHINYTCDTMIKKLNENGNGLTVDLPNGKEGILANNGKKFVYNCEKLKPKTTTTSIKPSPSTSKGKPTATNSANSDECYGVKVNYPCCKRCSSYYSTDADGHKWGFENLKKCSIKYSC